MTERPDRLLILRFISALVIILYMVPLYSAPVNSAELYKKAEKHYKAFINNKNLHNNPAAWEKCVNRYREIVILKEDSIYADDAAYMVAYIYFRMYERFSNQAYLTASTSSFNYIIQHYPNSLYLEKTLYYMGYIHYKYLNDKQAAQQFFNTLVTDYPESKYTEQAKDYLDLVARASTPPPPKKNGGFAVLNDLRYWSSPDYTRVVAYLDGPTSFINRRLYKPDRIYFDFDKTRISKQISEWMMVVEDNFLKRVRIGHFDTKTTRVVLDLEKVGKYTVFTLTDPFRLVIDVTSKEYKREEKLPQLAQLEKKNIKPGSAQKPGTNASKKPVKTEPKPADIPPDKQVSKPTPKTTEKTTTIIPLKNSSGDYSIVRQLGLGVTTIVIDPGHGGKDPGVVISKGVYEKDLVLDVALQLKDILEKEKGYQVFLTRKGDEYIPLEERTAKAMQYKADLFISLHMNSYRKRSLSGMEIYYLGFATDRQTKALAAYENAVNQQSIGEIQDILKMMVNAKVEESQDMAKVLHTSLPRLMQKKYSFFRIRRIKQAPFIVLIGANMPSLLIELGYLSNNNEKKYLLTRQYRQSLAENLATGIEKYIRNLNGKIVQK